MAKLDLVSNEWTDLVFEGRNQAYGAYKLRKGTTKRNIWSIVIVFLAAVLLFLGLQLQKMAQANKTVENTQAVQLATLQEKKKEAKVEKKEVIKTEPEKVVEQVKSSVKFTAPVIKKDEEVKAEDEIQLEEVEKSTKAVGAKAKEEIKAPEPPKHVEEEKVFDVVEQMPSFPGGNSALMKFLNENIHYPVVAQENGVQGRVVISFVVERDGHITDVQVARSVDPSLDKEAQRVVKSMPKWIPGKQNGSAVRVKYNVPVSFRLQ